MDRLINSDSMCTHKFSTVQTFENVLHVFVKYGQIYSSCKIGMASFSSKFSGVYINHPRLQVAAYNSKLTTNLTHVAHFQRKKF